MNRTKKIWLGVLSFSPLVLTTIFICIALLFYMKIVFGAINGSLGYSDEREFIILLIFMIIIIKGWQTSTLWFIKAKN